MLSNFRWWLANQLVDVSLIIKATRILATVEENERVVEVLRQNVRKSITEKFIVEQIEVDVIQVTLDNND